MPQAPHPRARLPVVLYAAVVFVVATAAAAVTSGAEPIDNRASLLEVEAYVRARSAFDRNCFRCHTGSGDEATGRGVEKLDMGRYPFAGKRGPTASQSVRKAIGATGGRATMPKDDPGSLSAVDTALILKWADTYDAVRGIRERQSGSGGAAGPSGRAP